MIGRKDVMRAFGLRPPGLAMRGVDDGPTFDVADEARKARKALDALVDGSIREAIRFSRKFDASGALEDLDQALKAYETANSHDPTGAYCLENMAFTYSKRYRVTQDPEDLDMAIQLMDTVIHIISIKSEHIPMPPLHPCASLRLERYERFSHSPADLHHAMQLYRARMHYPELGPPLSRFQAARAYADLCLLYKDAMAAMRPLRIAVDLVESIVRPTGDLARRHLSLLPVRSTIAFAVSVALEAEEVSRALEWFERGRCIIWTHILRVQTSTGELQTVDAALADQNRRLVKQLHAAEEDMERPAWHPGTLQSYMRHGILVKNFDALTVEARKLPGLEGFLSPKAPSELMMAATLGPVIILNVSDHRCDAIILRRNQVPEHVSLPALTSGNLGSIAASYQHCLHEAQRGARGVVMSRSGASHSMERILLALWNHIVEPVFQHLGLTKETSTPEDKLPRITWCLSGPLTSLPLHATGNYTVSRTRQHRAYDYAVHSYAPSLSALIEALSRRGQVVHESGSRHPNILAISQPETPKQSPLPGTVGEVAAIKNVVGAETMTWLNGPDATKSAVLDCLDRNAWAHFACHAVQDPERPTQSAFMLQDGGLTLHELMRRTSTTGRKELAVLSACQTATGDAKVPEEAVHLAAGMLMTGFRSVIATMWSIGDDDAPIVMEAFYDYLVHKANGDGALSAHALHYATKILREKVGERKFMHWVPFIHLGV
ncbi:unnamed protein product [Peniophora sp. CBMAI 1063]|nr:unnamed protein product [Peniophora sp. CBMAI 1063]